MRNQTILMTLSVCATVIITAAILANAGPLTPPPGPVASTPEIEPRIAINATNTPGSATSLFVITQPGSYYLTGNVTGGAGRHGVEIAASGVTLDLMGFELLGVPGSLDGVSVTASVNNVRIHSGSVRSWGQSGVEALLASNAVLRDLVASDNGFDGLRVGNGAVVEGCVARSNSFSGIVGNRGSTISACTALSNGGTGVSVGEGSTVAGCTASFNRFGVIASAGSTIRACTARSNDTDGISVSISSTIIACTARINGNSGIVAGAGSTISACTASGNTNFGIATFAGVTVSACTAGSNGNGIFAGAGSTINGCTASGNVGDGILASSDSLVVGNACDSNGLGAGDGAGIHVTNADNRIEGNTVTGNDRGVDVDLAGNLIIRNSASGNIVNYSIVASNKVGSIVSAPNSAAINGAIGGAGVGTTNPWANFSF